MKSTIVYTVFIFAIYKFDYYVTRPLMGQVFKNRWILSVRDSGMWYILRALFYYLMSKLKTSLKQSPLILQLFRFEPPGNAQTTVWIVSVLKECVVHPKADQPGLKLSVVSKQNLWTYSRWWMHFVLLSSGIHASLYIPLWSGNLKKSLKLFLNFLTRSSCPICPSMVRG